MTPLIDVVFQLLSFFLFTFQIAATEVAFNVEAPAAPATESSTPALIPPLIVCAIADNTGDLVELQLNGESVNMAKLKNRLQAVLDAAPAASPALEIRVQADPGLDYQRLIDVLGVVMGQQEGAGENRQPRPRVKLESLKR